MVAAVVLAELGAEVDFFCALGSDANGDAAEAELTRRRGVVHAARRPGPTRQVMTLLDHVGERTIITIGERMRRTATTRSIGSDSRDADGVYLTAGDLGATQRARAGAVLVATPRIRERLEHPDVMLDALVFSASDLDEARWAAAAHATRQIDGRDRGQGRRPLVGRVRGPLDGGAAAGTGARQLWLRRLVRRRLHVWAGGGRRPGEAARIGAECGARMLTRVGAP